MKITKATYSKYKALCDNMPKKDAVEYLGISTATVDRIKGSKDYQDYRIFVDASNGKHTKKSNIVLALSLIVNVVLALLFLGSFL